MRMRGMVVVGLLCLALAAGAAQHEAGRAEGQEVQKEVAEAVQAIREYGADRRDQAVREVKQALERLDARIQSFEDRLETRHQKMEQQARERARATLKALRQQRREVAEWYGGMQHSSKEAWEHVKQGLLESYDALGKAFEKAEKEF